MQTNEPVYEAPGKKNQTLLIVAAVAIGLCCCLVILVVAGYYGYNTMRVTNSEVQPVEDVATAVPVIPDDSSQVDPQDSGTYELGEAPTGGLGNDVLRNDTWTYVSIAAAGQGCAQPLGADTTIDVLQEPQNGVWVEQWNVACASGDTYSYEITFTLDDTGARFDIKSLQ